MKGTERENKRARLPRSKAVQSPFAPRLKAVHTPFKQNGHRLNGPFMGSFLDAYCIYKHMDIHVPI